MQTTWYEQARWGSKTIEFVGWRQNAFLALYFRLLRGEENPDECWVSARLV
jgi:hypothetical protein